MSKPVENVHVYFASQKVIKTIEQYAECNEFKEEEDQLRTVVQKVLKGVLSNCLQVEIGINKVNDLKEIEVSIEPSYDRNWKQTFRITQVIIGEFEKEWRAHPEGEHYFKGPDLDAVFFACLQEIANHELEKAKKLSRNMKYCGKLESKLDSVTRVNEYYL